MSEMQRLQDQLEALNQQMAEVHQLLDGAGVPRIRIEGFVESRMSLKTRVHCYMYDNPAKLPCKLKPGSPYYPNTLEEKIAYFIEECGEALAAAGKAQRRGLDSFDPRVPEAERETNAAWLRRELRDLKGAIALLEPVLADE
jgi:hypothetical protein